MDDFDYEFQDLLDELDNCLNIEDYKKNYNKMLNCVKTGDQLNMVIQYKLEEITGFSGTYNQDFTDFIRVIKLLASKVSVAKCGLRRVEVIMQEDVAHSLGLSEDYTRLIYSVLCSKNCLEYGTSLRGAWICELGEEVLNIELGSKFLEVIKENLF